MQSVLSRIWTRVAVSISCDDNHYTTVTHFCNISLYDQLVNYYFTENALYVYYLFYLSIIYFMFSFVIIFHDFDHLEVV